jgi:hypothetical protein
VALVPVLLIVSFGVFMLRAVERVVLELPQLAFLDLDAAGRAALVTE